MAIVAFGAFACGSSSTASTSSNDPRVFTGEVTDTDARLAAVLSARHARIYVCGGSASLDSLSRWFPVDIDASGGLIMSGLRADGWRLDGALANNTISGSFSMVDSPTYSFQAEAVRGGTIAGLYEASAPCGKIGLIVTQPSADVEAVAQGACIPSDGSSTSQVNPLLPLAREPDGTIRVTVGLTGAAMVVRAALPPDD